MSQDRVARPTRIGRDPRHPSRVARSRRARWSLGSDQALHLSTSQRSRTFEPGLHRPSIGLSEVVPSGSGLRTVSHCICDVRTPSVSIWGGRESARNTEIPKPEASSSLVNCVRKGWRAVFVLRNLSNSLVLPKAVHGRIVWTSLNVSTVAATDHRNSKDKLQRKCHRPA